MAQQEWFYAIDGTQSGPVTLDALRQLTASGNVKPTDLVWREGMADWIPASTVADLAPSREARPVAIAPAAASAPISPIPAARPLPAQSPSPAAVLPYGGGGSGAYGAPVTARTVQLLSQTRPWVLFFAVLMFLSAAGTGLLGLGWFLGGVAGGVSGGGGGAAFGAFGIIAGLFHIGFAMLAFMPGLYLSRYASRISRLRAGGGVDELEAALEAQKSYWKFIGIMVLAVIAFYIVVFLTFLVIATSMR